MWSSIKSSADWLNRPAAISERQMVWMLGLIMLLGLGIRLLVRHWEPTIARDGIFYLQCAEYYAGKPGAVIPENLSHAPLFIGFLTFFVRSGWNGETAGIVLNIVAGTLLPLPVAWSVRELGWSRGAALAAAALVAVHPATVNASVELLRESTYLFFGAMTFAMALRAAKPQHSYWWWVVSGGCAGLAALIRYEALEFLVLMGGGAATCLCCGLADWKKCLRAVALFTIGLALTCWVTLELLDLSPQEYFLRAHGKITHLLLR